MLSVGLMSPSLKLKPLITLWQATLRNSPMPGLRNGALLIVTGVGCSSWVNALGGHRDWQTLRRRVDLFGSRLKLACR